MLDIEIRRDMARRLYAEGTDPSHEGGQQAYLDGLWMGLVVCGGMSHDEFELLEANLWDLVDGLIEGTWE